MFHRNKPHFHVWTWTLKQPVSAPSYVQEEKKIFIYTLRVRYGGLRIKLMNDRLVREKKVFILKKRRMRIWGLCVILTGEGGLEVGTPEKTNASQGRYVVRRRRDGRYESLATMSLGVGAGF